VMSIDFERGASPYVLCNRENLINKLTNEYICLYNLFIIRGGLKQRTVALWGRGREKVKNHCCIHLRCSRDQEDEREDLLSWQPM